MNKLRTICLSMLGLGLLAAAPIRPATKKTIAEGPMLWHGVRAGMTEQQLRTALQDVQQTDKEGAFTAQAVVVDYQTLRPTVYMSGGKVVKVVLQGGSGDALAKSLTEKYGEPFAPYRCHRMGGAIVCRGDWRLPGGVKVWVAEFSGRGVSMTKTTYEMSDAGSL